MGGMREVQKNCGLPEIRRGEVLAREEWPRWMQLTALVNGHRDESNMNSREHLGERRTTPLWTILNGLAVQGILTLERQH